MSGLDDGEESKADLGEDEDAEEPELDININDVMLGSEKAKPTAKK